MRFSSQPTEPTSLGGLYITVVNEINQTVDVVQILSMKFTSPVQLLMFQFEVNSLVVRSATLLEVEVDENIAEHYKPSTLSCGLNLILSVLLTQNLIQQHHFTLNAKLHSSPFNTFLHLNFKFQSLVLNSSTLCAS